MRTENFQNCKNEISINKCMKYSDSPEQLEEILKSIEVSVKFTGIKKHFHTDNEERLTGIFRIERKGKTIEFDFGFSLNDAELFNGFRPFGTNKFNGKIYDNYSKLMDTVKTKKKEFFEGLLYSCLCSCKSDIFAPTSFNDFCDEFGYNIDSIKDRDLFLSCLDQAAKLQRIFRSEEIEYLPI